MTKFFEIVCCATAMIVLGTGCSVFSSQEVTVSRDDSLKQQREYFRNELVNSDGLMRESENFLRGNLMLDEIDRDPQLILKKINDFYQLSDNPKYLLIAADLCRCLAAQSEENEAIRYHLSSFHYSIAYLRTRKKNNKSDQEKIFYDFTLTQSLQNYNEACCGIFSFLKKRNLLEADSITLRDAEDRQFVLAKPIFKLSVSQEAVEDFSLCSSYTVKDLMQINRQPGVGVPLVAKLKAKQWTSSLKTPKGLTIPVTLLLKNDSGPAGEELLSLVFVDTSMRETIPLQINDGAQPQCAMALDFSTPLALFLNDLTQRNLLAQMLNAFDQEAGDGLYMIEPYHADKIPVVLVHGLMSSPETWMQMLNSLKNDPTIRKHYQFWFFSYSTGAPVMLSATKLRTALRAAEKEFCTTPEATANFNRMVIVGHSMGGLLTRLMVQQEPYAMYEGMMGLPIEQIKAKLLPEDWEYLDSFAPRSLPFVHRVIFLAVPHRGAEMAQWFIARLGISLIKLPASILSRETTIKRILKTLDPEGRRTKTRNQFFTGIDNLDPDNPLVQSIGNSQMKADLTYHCIIGNRSEDGVPGNSDGVVPYWSSHLDGAASELVVKSGHSVHRTPGAIQEVLRILLLHLESAEAK